MEAVLSPNCRSVPSVPVPLLLWILSQNTAEDMPSSMAPGTSPGIRGGKAQPCSSSPLLCSHNSIRQGETPRSTEIAAGGPDIRTSTAVYALCPTGTPRVADVKGTWKLLVGDREEVSFMLMVLNYQLFL